MSLPIVFINIPLSDLYIIPTQNVLRIDFGDFWITECLKDDKNAPCVVVVDRFNGAVKSYYDFYRNENESEHQKIFLEPRQDGPLFHLSPDDNFTFVQYIKPQIKALIYFKQLDESFYNIESDDGKLITPSDDLLMNALIQIPIQIIASTPFTYSINTAYIYSLYNEDEDIIMSNALLPADVLKQVVHDLNDYHLYTDE